MIDTPSDDDILDLAERGDREASLEWYRRQGERSPYFFSKVIAGYGELTPDLHQPVCQWLVDSEADRGRGLLFPRKYFKSSMTKGYVLRRIVKNPEIRILFVGENDDVGAKNLADIQWKIREDKLFQELYPSIIPEDKGRDWLTSSLTLPRKKSYDEPTIQSIGIGTKHTGFHYNLIVYDDPVGWMASRSKPEMDRAIDWFQAAPGMLDSNDSEELYIGTRWKHGKADLPGWIMAEMPFREVDGVRQGFVWHIRAAIEEGASIFPRQVSQAGKKIGYSIPDLMVMKKRQGTYLFNANMMNNPTAGEDTDFPESSVKKYRISEDRKACILLDTNERVELASLVRLSVYDPSSGGISAEAENAIVVIGHDPLGRILALDRWSKNCGFGRAIEQWHVMNDKWKCWRNWFEAVGAHKEVGPQILARENPCKSCGKTHLKIRARPINPPPGNKEDRIRDMAQPSFEEGRVYIAEHMTDLERQILDFPHGELVDLFDALAYAISKSRKPLRKGGEDSAAPKSSTANPRMGHSRTHSTVDYGGY